MSLSDIKLQTLQAVQSSLIAQVLESRIVESLMDSLLRPYTKKDQDLLLVFMSSSLDSKAGILRQDECTVRDGLFIARALATATASVQDSLSAMRCIAKKAASAPPCLLDRGDTATFNAAREKLVSTIREATCHGISLLNKTHWAGDSRLKMISGNTAEFVIRTSKKRKRVFLHDLSSLLEHLPGTADLAPSTVAMAAVNTLYHYSIILALHQFGYNALVVGLEGMAEALATERMRSEAESKSILSRSVPPPDGISPCVVQPDQ